MSTGLVLLIVFGALMGTCMTCGAITGATKKNDRPVVTAVPSGEPNRQQALEKNAVDTFPQKKADIAATLKRATTAAEATKWAQASTELTTAETDLAAFEGTSVATDKDFVDLKSKAAALHKRIAPQAEKLAKAAAAASAEKDLAASSIAVTSMQLFNEYQANEVAADNRYKARRSS